MIVVNSRLILCTKAPLLLKRIFQKHRLPTSYFVVASKVVPSKLFFKDRLQSSLPAALASLPIKSALASLLGCIISLFSVSLPAHAHDALKMTLTSSKVVVDRHGNRGYIPVSTAKVGTLIQYKATYTNTLDAPIKNTNITLPIPTNTEFTGEAYPPSAQGSIDYYNYQDIPLKRVIEGKMVDVPFSEYKSLRWNIKYIPAHKSIDVAFNTIVN